MHTIETRTQWQDKNAFHLSGKPQKSSRRQKTEKQKPRRLIHQHTERVYTVCAHGSSFKNQIGCRYKQRLAALLLKRIDNTGSQRAELLWRAGMKVGGWIRANEACRRKRYSTRKYCMHCARAGAPDVIEATVVRLKGNVLRHSLLPCVPCGSSPRAFVRPEKNTPKMSQKNESSRPELGSSGRGTLLSRCHSCCCQRYRRLWISPCCWRPFPHLCNIVAQANRRYGAVAVKKHPRASLESGRPLQALPLS